MKRQVGMIDAELLARVDERAQALGQTRRAFVEIALQIRLRSVGEPPVVRSGPAGFEMAPPAGHGLHSANPNGHYVSCKCPECETSRR